MRVQIVGEHSESGKCGELLRVRDACGEKLAVVKLDAGYACIVPRECLRAERREFSLQTLRDIR